MTIDPDDPQQLRVIMSSVERRGPWTVPRRLVVRVVLGRAELDLRDATLAPGVTTIDAQVTMGSLELVVPPGLAVEIDVDSVASNVEQPRPDPGLDDPSDDPARPRLRVVGRVQMGNCEVLPVEAGLPHAELHRRRRERARAHHRALHAHHRRRWEEVRRERDLWRHHPGRAPWMPWWLMARMRRRIFTWFAIAFSVGLVVGYRWEFPRWWQGVLAFVVLSGVSGAIAWRLTRPLLAVVQAARDIGDGHFDTRLDVHDGGEMGVLAAAINEMAAKIQQQLADQRQLLAAVSHELRTPLGHMRILIDTAREGGNGKTLDELEREVLTLDDLVGRLLASSRLEFGTLDRRAVDLGELVADVATSAGVPADAIEASDGVRVAVDPTLVRRAVANLLDNARIHGGGVVAVRIERRAGQVAIEVDDAGPGVPPDRRADAFRAFVPSSGGGLGLGLALVSRIAVAHGGGAWIRDRPGGGARVGFAVEAA